MSQLSSSTLISTYKATFIRQYVSVTYFQLSESQAAAIKAVHEYFQDKARKMLRDDLASGEFKDVFDLSLRGLLLEHLRDV